MSDAPIDDNIRTKRDRFDHLYADWLKARAVYADPSLDPSDTVRAAKSDAVDAAARLLLATPAVLGWMVWMKFEVFDGWLAMGEDWTDNRLTFAAGCIK